MPAKKKAAKQKRRAEREQTKRDNKKTSLAAKARFKAPRRN